MSLKNYKLLRLNPNHPTYIKFEKLCQLADDLGITITWQGTDVFIHDKDASISKMYLSDIEEHHWISSFPPNKEYSITYNNPDYNQNNF